IEIGFRQTRWEGGVGVFFGFHEARAPQGQPCKKFQMISLRSGGDPKLPYHLDRIGCFLTSLPSGGYDFGKEAFAPQPIATPPDHEYRLEITVEARRLTSVRWGGVSFPE